METRGMDEEADTVPAAIGVETNHSDHPAYAPNERSNNMNGSVVSVAEQPLEMRADFRDAAKKDADAATVKQGHTVPKATETAAAQLTSEQSSFLMAAAPSKSGHSGKSSLELRKMPVNVLLRADSKFLDEELSQDDDSNEFEMDDRRTLLQRTCLNSKFTLRAQMMLSFGVISFATILMVVIVSIALSMIAGKVVKEMTRDTFNDVAASVLVRATRYVAEGITPRILMKDAVDILCETTKDRFYGYPTKDDSKVPFFDTISRTNKYPVKGQPLPLDWQMDVNVNQENQDEHVQGRLHLYGEGAKVSTANAVYIQQGMCDPTETDPSQETYLEGCTEAHNNISTGGVVAPSPTNEQIHRKASDLTPILKSLYEYHQEVRAIGIYFSNSGAGSAMTYPGNQLYGTSSYKSIGCDWLKGPHPLDPSRSILSEVEVERCTNGGTRVNGSQINSRLFSSLDRAWCRDQVLHPGKLMIMGPFKHAYAAGVWVITIGRSIYDPVTNELVACTTVSVDADSMSSTLETSKVTPNSHVSVVYQNPEGTVLASTAWNLKNASDSVTILDLDVGVSQEVYQEFYGLVDYSIEWNATKVRQAYEDLVVVHEGFLVKAYPIPPLPDIYDETYIPQFLVIFSVSETDLFMYSNQIDEDVDERVRSLTILSVSVGLAGLVAVIAVLVVVSNYITRPLKKMNETATRIIHTFGDDSTIEIEDTTKEGKGECIRTELSEIVKEFQRMVRKFSGGAMASAAKVGATEVHNDFQLADEFQDLYASRQSKDFKYQIEQSNPSTNGLESVKFGRRHMSRNVVSGGASTVRNSTSHPHLLTGDRQNAYSSPLFQWIVVLIVLPLLLSTISISTVVVASVSQELPDMIHDGAQGLLGFQVNALAIFAGLRASFVARSSEKYIRDLHVFTRYTSWLLFGGLKADGYQQTISAVSSCKGYSSENYTECPFVQENYVCDCSWNPTAALCRNYSDNGIDSRYLQIPGFTSCSEDADVLTGDRLVTSFPALADSPKTTQWWRNQEELPGSPAGWKNRTSWFVNDTGDHIFVPGHQTTYRRVGTGAAVPLFVPFYNIYYDMPAEGSLPILTFEADGTVISYNGCNSLRHAVNPMWQSTKENGAAELRPELCPVGKYGYDPRCRGWYDSGRSLFLAEGAPLYVTPPYPFAGVSMVGQSCTAPLFDPNTKEHVGQMLVDFTSTRIFNSLDQVRTPLARDGFHLLITPQKDVYGADVVIGPGLSITEPARPVQLVVKARNESCDKPLCGFARIVKSMKAGESGTGSFEKEDADGNPIIYHIAYSPVVVKSLKQLNASDFARGVELLPHGLYSVALAEPEASMLESFQETERKIEKVIHVGLAILCILIVVASGLVVWLSNRITISLTEPMYYLLNLIRHINRLHVGEDPPDEDMQARYGSSEVLNVRMTMEKLYKIIQCANAAFFAGKTEVAYTVLTDALQLFIRLDNKKAMGVASNNLGNTMTTLYTIIEATGDESVCGMTKQQLIGKGMAYFHQAIQLGEKAYDEFYESEGWGPNCLHFMQHLSNRYFNRAMFLLTVKNDHENPKEIEELGRRDLQIARDMDIEIVDEGTQVGWDVRSAQAHLEVLLCRIRGHITLLELGYHDEWDVDEMLDSALKILKVELKKDSTDLFTDIGPVGRIQQIESLLMRYSLVQGDLENAARIGIRMLVEDEFILPEAQEQAIVVMIDYAKYSPNLQTRLREYQTWELSETEDQKTQASSKNGGGGAGSLFGSTMALSRQFLDTEKSNTNSAQSMRFSLRGDIVMEAF